MEHITLLGVIVMTSTTVLFIISWVYPKWRNAIYFEFKEVEDDTIYSLVRAYYSRHFKALCHDREVETVRDLNKMFKTLDKMTKKYNLTSTTGFFTTLGDYHMVSVDRIEKNKYVVGIYDIDDDAACYTMTPIEHTHYTFEHTTNDINELMAEAWAHCQTTYREWVGPKLEAEAVGEPWENI
jgi:hypothetical protein